MRLTPDEHIFWQEGFVTINATIVFTWIVMFLLVLISWLATRKLSIKKEVSHLQNIMEVVVKTLEGQVSALTKFNIEILMPFIGTLFLFILLSNLLSVVPGFIAPTGSLSTTVAFSLCVFLAVPIFGIKNNGFVKYTKKYIEPNPILLPLNVVGEVSQTISLAVRLYGNIMSGAAIGAVLLGVIPLFFPVLMQLLGLISGVIQAYIFAMLAMVYITASDPRVE